MGSAPTDEITLLSDGIRRLLDTPLAERDQSLERLETTLTEGYAHALTLEAERRRLERKIAQLGASIGDRNQESAQELATLAGRLSETTNRLAGLRDLLEGLRVHASAVRAGGAYAAIENAAG